MVFWYGLQARPLDIGTAPKGHVDYTKVHKHYRHGLVAYAERLSDEEVCQFELNPIRGAAEIMAKIIEALGDYADIYGDVGFSDDLMERLNTKEIQDIVGPHNDIKEIHQRLRFALAPLGAMTVFKDSELRDNIRLSRALRGLLKKHSTKFELVGSRITCSPPPTDTDLDILCLTGDVGAFEDELLDGDFERGGSEVGDSRAWEGQATPFDKRFVAYRKNHINLIITKSSVFYDKFLEASIEAKRQNLTEKADRIKLFQEILYQNFGDAD